jgi:hypothetical protein
MINTKLLNRIVEGLVRIDDIVEDRDVYGGISQDERDIIKQSISESIDAGIDYGDSISALVEYFKHQQFVRAINEVGVIGTVGSTPATGAAPAPSAGAVTKPPIGQPTANAAPTSAGTVTKPPPPPLNQQGLSAMAQMLANAGINQNQLATITSKARQEMAAGQGQ